jgi:hypothetical protein
LRSFRLSWCTIFLVVVFLGTVFIGCSTAQKPPAGQQPEQLSPSGENQPGKLEPEPNGGKPALKPGNYFPLTKGSTWKYQGEGNEYAAFNREVLFIKENLAQLKEDNGGTVSASIFKVTDNEIIRIYFQGEVYEAINLLDRQSNDDTIILKAPLETGTKWNNRDHGREIVDINATITTPAGKFENCIKVKITNPYSTLYEYYKEEVGLVKREFHSEQTLVTSSLEQYSVKITTNKLQI